MNKEQVLQKSDLKKEVDRLEIKIDEIQKSLNGLTSMFEKFVEYVQVKFISIDERFDTIEGRVGNLEVGLKNNQDILSKQGELLKTIDYDLHVLKREVSTKEDIKNLDAHIGNMERRFQKIEEIVLQDHRPRIFALEQAQ